MDEVTPNENAKPPAQSPTPRKRLGRPPKAHPKPIDKNVVAEATAEDMETTETSAERVLTVSPTLSSECRRSSRKKIIKFDVRDLLNKNRKTHKIQIEARINSKAPPTANDATTPSTRSLATLDGGPAESTATAARQLPSGPPPPLVEIFAKPKLTKNLNIAQVNSEETCLAGQQKQNEPPQAGAMLVQRKRGRPRKAQPAQVIRDVCAIPAEITRSISYSDSDTNSANSTATGESDACCENKLKPKFKSKLRVSLKRMNMPISRDSFDSGESLKGPSLPFNLLELSTSSSEVPALHAIDEVNEPKPSVNTKMPAETKVNIKTDTITMLPGDEEDSAPQIIFEEVETAKPEKDNEMKARVELPTEESSNNFKLLFPKKEEQQPEQKTETESDSTPSLCSAKDVDKQQLDPESLNRISSLGEQIAEKQNIEANCEVSPPPTSKRRSKRSSLRGSALSANGSKMTLEETFAEIAAVSSKRILQSEAVEEPQQQQLQLQLDAPIDLVGNCSNICNSSNSNSNLFELSPQLEANLETNCKFETQKRVSNTSFQSETNTVQLECAASEQLESLKVTAAEAAKVPTELPAQAIDDKMIATVEQQPSPDQSAAEAKETLTPLSSLSNPILPAAATAIELLSNPSEALLKLEPPTRKAELPLEQQMPSGSPTPTANSNVAGKAKQEKVSASQVPPVSIVECDALFKAMDKARAQVRHDEKTKKKLKLCAKKHAAKLELQPEGHSNSNSPTVSLTNAKKQRLKKNTRRNTICEYPAEQSPALLTKRRNSQHPQKTSQSPESPTQAEPYPKAKLKKMLRKRLSSSLIRQNSVDSSSSASQCAFRRKSSKVSDALQLALTETESTESTSSASKVPSCGIPTPISELETPDPLNDIAQLIENGVKLLEHKLEDAQQEQQQQQQLITNVLPDDDFAQRVANMETPATTPSSSPQPSSGTSCNEDATPTVGSGAVRRSHRIKQKPQLPKASVGRGVSSSSQTSSSISMEEQLTELAHIDAINEQFLRQEGLNVFQLLRDNYYRCARQVSQENAEMQCDCFLTGDEEAMGHLCCGAGCINRMLMIECGPLCTNGERCTNKRFQLHQCWPCRVFRTEKKGCGITAELQIPPGEFIMEYVGEVIDSEEFERRQHLYSRDRNRHYYFMALRGEAIIDATAKGNISRYINHSCDPNAETQKWTVNGELRIGFFSVKTIMPGEEITFDYQYQRYGRDAQRCYCEATNCRGWIGGEPDSDEGEQLDAESDSEADNLAEEPDELESGQGPETDKKAYKTKSAKSSKLKPSKPLKVSTAARKMRKELPKAKDREYKAGRWLRPSGGGIGDKSAARKLEKLEDPDVLEQLLLLNRSGLKNQVDTLRFSRCMVRAKLLQTRLQLLGVLTRGELPCRRLFLDYHGLRLLHAWISESGNDNQLRLALLDALESLPIPNRTMLNDSRVYQSVQLWSTSMPDEQPKEPQQQPSQSKHELEAVRQRMVALLQKWNALPEIFRIPKRERIEQMKEHEREADRQQQPHYTATALEDSNSNSASSVLNSDRYRQDRFRRATINRYEKPKQPTRMSGNNTICSIPTQPKERSGNAEGGGGSSGSGTGNANSSFFNGISKSDPRRRSEPVGASDYDTRRTIFKKLRRSLFERKVAQDEAEKRVCSVDWREHELRCEYFGADLKTDPKQLPFYQNTETNEWFNSDDAPVKAPPRCGNGNSSGASSEPHSPESSGDSLEYRLPGCVEPLPPSWHWSVTADGDIYYYNLRDRISQWEPPNAQQRLQQLIDDSPVPERTTEAEHIADELVKIDVDYVGSLSNKSLAQYIEAKVRERRELRRNRLVSVCVISPRREEDRIYNQLEARRYKENKEKIRRRKELFRCTQNETNNTDPLAGKSSDMLPIQGYLYSSDEDVDVDAANLAPGCAALPLLDVIVDGVKDTHVDELEALNRSRNNNNIAKISTSHVEPSTSKSALAALGIQLQSMPLSMLSELEGDGLVKPKRKLPMPPQLPESQKKHRGEREKKRKTPLSSTSSGREACEKFRFEISGHVAEFLRPYRKDTCHLGRITNDADYKFLIKRLSHHITTKEMRYCDLIGNPLACTESVKHKSFEFINQYMRKKGRVYRKPADEPDY
ncbi:probable histone-lysine N-methyltransferase CG1716 [Drosophila montana]|uniref:probable histone-lysine N-methyltransferase CG1716 n=1 Tax=Drosophila montana TaxID=40370 RepID=UPI00313E4CD6